MTDKVEITERRAQQVYRRSARFLARQAPISRRNYKAPALVSIVAAAVAWGFGAWLEILTNYFYVFLVVYLLRVSYWVKELQVNPQAADQLSRSGSWTVLAVYVVVAAYVALRIPNLPLWASFLIFLVACVIAWIVLWPLISEGVQTARRMAYIGILGRPALVAWIFASLVFSASTYLPSAMPPDVKALKEMVQDTLANRKQIKTKAGSNVTVAVALSGGGYRAATIHAGVLKVLDEADIAIDYLSTVSGGSIVGASYALGYTPTQFQKHARNPGLPNYLFHILYFLLAAVTPVWSDSDTYALHFSQVYFADATLGDVERPVLLVNATNYTTRRREVFPSAPSGERAKERLADLVAASGAFPGAFELKKLNKIGDSYYMDGGVVENLGLEGLREYFRADASRPKPDVLIISNASKAVRPLRANRKTFRFRLLNQASTDTYEALHEQIFRIYTDNAYDPTASGPLKQPYVQRHSIIFGEQASGAQSSGEKVLYTFILNGTAPAEKQYMTAAGKKRVEEDKAAGKPTVITESTVTEVAGFSTLKELTQAEVERGAWVGATIAGEYATLIKCYLQCLQNRVDPVAACGSSDGSKTPCG